MKTILMIAALALASPAAADSTSTVQVDPAMSLTMEAAGGLTTLMAICPDFDMPADQRERMRILEEALKTNPVYVEFFDHGVAMMTEEAVRNPNVCRDQLGDLQSY